MRQLGKFEKLIWQADQVYPLNFATTAQIRGCVSINIIRQAIDIVKPHYPTLNISVTHKEGVEFFRADLNPIPLQHIHALSQAQVWAKIENELNTPFNPHCGPLIRISVLSFDDIHEIIATFHHIIADGISGSHFLIRLIGIIDTILAKKKINTTEALSLLPSLDSLLKIERSNNGNFNFNFQKDKNRIQKGITLATKIIHEQINIEHTQQIVDYCHLNKISVHSLICAALSETLLERNSNTPDKVMCLTPVNMRPYLETDVTAEDMGYLLSRIDILIQRNNSSNMLTKAKFITKQINESIELGAHHEFLCNLDSFLSLYSQDDDFYEKTRFHKPCIFVSNLGCIENKIDLENLKITRLHFSFACQGLFDNKNSIGIAISTFENIIYLNFHYLSPLYCLNEMNKLSQIVMEKLKNLK